MESCGSDSDCSTLFDDLIHDNPSEKCRRRIPPDHFQNVKKPAFSTYADFDALRNALDILKSSCQSKPTRITCAKNKPNVKVIPHKTILHHCALIKHAILKKNWRMASKLLIEYIGERKRENFHEPLILKYTIIILLNDPVAIRNNSLWEFFNIGLSCRTKEERNELLKMLITRNRASKPIKTDPS